MLAAVLCQPLDAGDWPRWRGPDGDGTSDETGLIHRFPASGPKVLWRAKLGTGFSGLSVADGRVFSLFGENGREKIICFDALTGKEIWKVDSDADFAQGRSFGPRATPFVDGKLVYTAGGSGKLSCLVAATGKEIWSFNLYSKYHMQAHDEGFSCSPQIDGDKLVVSGGTAVFAFNKSDGKLVWRALEEKMNHSTPRFAKIDSRHQLVVLTAENLVGLDPESGDELWRHPQRAVNCATPAVGPGGKIFIAAAYGFGCQLVEVTGGTPEQVYWNNDLATHHATAMIYDGKLYGFHDRRGTFKCLDFSTGEEEWESEAPGKGKLIIADGQMIIVTEEGRLVLAVPTPDGYTETARAKVLDGISYTAPSLANGKLYIRSNEEMVCIDFKP